MQAPRWNKLTRYSNRKEISEEEDDAQRRSAKGLKESVGGQPAGMAIPGLSYRDETVGRIPGAFENAFRIHDGGYCD